MLVLVATEELQGTRPGDYSHTVEGELVTPVVAECASGDRCGCTRGFPGFASSRATTTAMVVDRPLLTPADLRVAVHDWLDRDGWIELLGDDLDGLADLIDEHVEAIEAVSARFGAGTIIGRSGSLVYERRVAEAA